MLVQKPRNTSGISDDSKGAWFFVKPRKGGARPIKNKMHGQPVEGGQNGRGVFPLTQSSQKTSCRILDQLET